MIRPALTAIFLLATAPLAACDSAEERVAKHFASAEALMADGDAERALVELRNVFKLDDDHKDGRLLYAGIMTRRGDLAEAAASYTMVSEQEPENADVHAELAQLAMTLSDWERAVRHATRAYQIDPETLRHRALYAAVAFREGDRPAGLDLARNVLDEDPGNLMAHTVLISDHMDAGRLTAALRQTDMALDVTPRDMGMHVIRLTLLEQLNRRDEVGTHLEAMVAQFPDQPQIEENLIQWYLREGRTEKAEAALRTRAEAGALRDALRLARFLRQTRGPEAALADLAARAEAATGADRHSLLRTHAAVTFDTGDRDRAIADLEALIAGADPDDETRISQVMLARMYTGRDRTEEASRLVETVLEGDPDMVEALMLRAHRLTLADDTDGAIRDLRRALEQAPDNARILTLMADAHIREGAHELAGERLALAVQASGNGVSESLRYARFLLADARLGPAESVVVDALRRTPENRPLLALLGHIHLERNDAPRALQVAAILDRQNTPDSTRDANTLRAGALRVEDRTDETIAFLEGLAAEGEYTARLAAAVPLVQTYIREGDMDRAEGALAALEAEFPDTPVVRMLRAGLFAIDGRTAEAQAIYEALIDEGAGGAQPWLTLYRLLRRTGDRDAAEALLTRGIADTGDAQLMLLRAANLEREDKDFEGAIAIYEELYARDTSNAILANNLASMISTYRTGDADLDRAFTIARRLRGTDVPPFQDTYGWLLTRRGDFDEALTYLRPAARALNRDPLVAYHLGVAEQGAGNLDAATEALSAALSLAEGDESLAPQMADAKARIAALKAARDAAAESEGSGN